jgi:AcrR family transcriptional regulator
MREIATKAGCSPGLTYRYFAGKEDLVLALYQQVTLELETRVPTLPAVPVADRFLAFMQIQLSLLSPYQEALTALFGAELNPRSAVGVLGEHTTAVRQRGSQILALVIQGSSDAPRRQQATELTTVLFGAHLGLIFFWLQDHSPDHQATQDLLILTRDLLALVRPLLRLPLVAHLLKRLALVAEPFLRLGILTERGGTAVESDMPGAAEERTTP